MEIEIENATQNSMFGILKKFNNRKTKIFFDAENNFLYLDIDTFVKAKSAGFRGNDRILIKLEKKKN